MFDEERRTGQMIKVKVWENDLAQNVFKILINI